MSQQPIEELQLVVRGANALRIKEKEAAALVGILQPIALGIPGAQQYADSLTITTLEEEAEAARQLAIIIANADNAEAAIDGFAPEILEGKSLVKWLYENWRGWTGGRGRIVDPLRAVARAVKGKIIASQEARKEAARKEQARLQAIENDRAQKEAARLAKAAEKLKAPELKQERLEAAAAVVPTQVYVPPPPSSVSTRKKWIVRNCDLEALGIPKHLVGYFKIERHPDGRFRSAVLSAETLAGAKTRNTQLEITGVTFAEVRV